METTFQSQGHAEDVVLWHRYNYYVLDAENDALERRVRAQWPIGLVSDTVGE